MSIAILRPGPLLSAVEAMNLRDSFKRVLENGGTGLVVDLTGVQELSAAGLAAVTNLVGLGRRSGIPVRVLMPEEGNGAARIVQQADLGRFLAPGGVWNTLPNDHSGSVKPGSRRSARRQRWLRRRGGASGSAPLLHAAAQ